MIHSLHQSRSNSLRNTLALLLGIASLCIYSSLQAQDQIGNQQSKNDLPNSAKELAGIEFEAAIRPWIDQAISEGKLPGCVIGVGNSQGLIYSQAFGNKSLEPVTPMTLDTVFDMASITKPVATATSVMQLIERGLLRVQDKVAAHLPEFAKHGKEEITVEQLLLHTSGLIPDNPLNDYLQGPELAWANICELKLTAPIGSAFKYSDVNFIVLGKLVEKLSDKRLDAYVQENLLAPLDMNDSGFNIPQELAMRAAPTEKRDEQWIQGQVHDPRAYALQGVAGHAGLFSTLSDLSNYAQAMLGAGQFRRTDGQLSRVLSAPSIARMTRGNLVPSGIRALGWDKRTGFSINRGDLFSDQAYGHGGFTGTVLWIDPGTDLFYIFLSNRVHPNGKGLVNPLAGGIANVAVRSFAHLSPTSTNTHNATSKDLSLRTVRCGIDVLESQNFFPLQNQRIGLITNHTGRNKDGISTVDLLRNAPNVKLKALFSPEHGFEGKLDIAKVDNAQDTESGLTIFSLYGETRKPTAEMLEDIDTIVFDIQDIGTRFYTYPSTMGEAMRAAAEHHKKFVVLDRPNPLGGELVSGPMLDPGKESFVAFHLLPVRHGLTIGELAKLAHKEWKLDLDLQVIPCEGWQRSTPWDQTGLTWINPSPNMRSLTQAFLYPGIGLLETTNISVGRGTDTPFQILGAPWINGPALVQDLYTYQLTGVTFVPIEFTPTSSKYANERCHGIEIIITDRQSFAPIPTGLAIALTLHKNYPEQWQTKSLNRLLGNQIVHDAILDSSLIPKSDPRIDQGIADFMKRRNEILLYP